MKYFFDTEFIESAVGIELISIGIVREDGKSLYAESASFDYDNADDWVKSNVISKLKFWRGGLRHGGDKDTQRKECPSWFNEDNTDNYFGHIFYIKMCVRAFFLDDPSPEFYAYYADYDWVLFCRLFGRMIDLPKSFPMFCIDLKQMMWERNLDKEWKRENCPDPEGEHDALVDAKWNLELYKSIIN